MRRLILSDTPSPWREPVFERVYNSLRGEVQVVYLNKIERRRLWTFDFGSHPKIIMRCLTVRIPGPERYFNPGIIPLLLRQRPKVALISDSLKDPTIWLAFLICRALRIKIALLDDSWLGRERHINALQKFARYCTYNFFGDAFVGASRRTLELFKYYNHRIAEKQLFLSPLVADNDFFNEQLRGKEPRRRFDVMFSGRIVQEKNPVFFADVCAKVKLRVGSCHALIIGDGQNDLKKAMCDIFDRYGVDYEFAGFIKHALLPGFYSQAKLLLFPTSGDCWGVVINEAMLAGTPVITTRWTAAEGELLLNEKNGLVLPLDEAVWTDRIVELLSNQEKWEIFSRNAQQKVQEFTFERAAAGILAAFSYMEEKA